MNTIHHLLYENAWEHPSFSSCMPVAPDGIMSVFLPAQSTSNMNQTNSDEKMNAMIHITSLFAAKPTPGHTHHGAHPHA
jgi:hypothetical protein